MNLTTESIATAEGSEPLTGDTALAMCWPMKSDGPLPKHLFPPDYLHHLFFNNLLVRWKLPASAVRKGLKSFGRRAAGARLDGSLPSQPVIERDAALIASVCANEKLRQKFTTLEFWQPSRKRPFKPFPFAETLWELGFREPKDAREYEIGQWIWDAVEERPGNITQRFFFASTLDRALAAGTPPHGLTDIAFQRALLLFAGVLDEPDRMELLEAAFRHGVYTSLNERVEIAAPAEPVPTLESSIAPLPRLVEVRPVTPSPPELTGEAESILNALARAATSTEATLDAARTALSAGIDRVVEASDGNFERVVSTLREARAGQIEATLANTRAQAYVDDVRSKLEALAGIAVDPPTGETAGERVREAWRAQWAVELLGGEEPVQVSWLIGGSSALPMARFTELPVLIAQCAAERAAGRAFETALQSALPNGDRAGVDNWLRQLTAMELLALAQSVDALGGEVTQALLIAYGVDRHGADFAEPTAKGLLTNLPAAVRRSVLRFVQASSAKLDSAPEFRRYVCREHFANLFTLGPLAQISDASVGAADDEVVGRNIVAAVEAITANLDIVSSVADIARRRAQVDRAGDNTAAKAAVAFIKTPAGMSGHFRRLREMARENLLLPLVDGDALNLRLAKDVIRRISNGDAEDEIFETTARGLAGHDRLESQHRLQLNRYLGSAVKQLEAAVRAESGKVDIRTTQFVETLDAAIAEMARSGPSGSIGWLEAEFVALLDAPEPQEPILTHSLTGDEQGLVDRLWSPQDEAWRGDGAAITAFYRDAAPTLWSVLTTLLAEGPRPPDRIADELLAEGAFSGALRLAVAAKRTPSLRGLRKRVEEAASPALRETRGRVEALVWDHGQKVIQAAEAYAPLMEALQMLRVQDAKDYLALLESELDLLKAQADEDAAVARDRVEASDLFSRLLRAGDQASDDDRSLHALQARWSTLLDRAQDRRAHLIVAEAVVGPILPDMHEFAPLLPFVAELASRSKDPDWWLPEETALELAEYLKPTIQQLKGWTDVVAILESETRRELGTLLIAFLQFLYDRTDALRGASTRDEVDAVLESVIEFDTAVASKSRPSDCLAALSQAGFSIVGVAAASDRPQAAALRHGRQNAMDFAKAVANAVTAKAWPELRLLGVTARAGTSDDEVQRVDEVVDFAQVMISLDAGDPAAAYDALDGAARAVSTSGHPIHRALPAREGLGLILRFLAVASNNKGAAKLPEGPLTWSSLLNGRPTLFRPPEGGEPTQLTRILAALFTAAQAFEIADAAWAAMTSFADAANIRADMLILLHELGQSDAVVRLCAKYDAPIKAKMEQLLELRSAAIGRPDLIPVAEALGGQIEAATRLAPVKQFLRRLPTAQATGPGALRIVLQDDLVLRSGPYSQRPISLSVTVAPEGIVPNLLQVQVFADDDVLFANRSGRLITLTEDLLYSPKDFVLQLNLGSSWDERIREGQSPAFRLRFSARTVTESIVTSDLEVVIIAAAAPANGPALDTDSLLEFYPGVGNTPAIGEAFIGRTESLEKLHTFLVAARQPSPVLLTGMRRVGKTSLLREFHRRHDRPGGQAITVYLSIAELRHQLLSPDATVSTTLYRAIARTLGKRMYSMTDQNRELGERLKTVAAAERGSMRAVTQECFDPESLADSLMLLTDWVLGAVGNNAQRLIILLDEAEALVVPYQAGGEKKLQLEQLLQSLREISQTSDRFAMVLSGSNHIAAFAREYKNAFFGSCVNIELEGITSVDEASRLIAPPRVRPFIQFDPAAIRFGVELCAGMPQFMWQLGAATAYAVRSGVALRSDVRSAVSALVDGDPARLPFKSYDVLEPIEHMLSLQGDREQDLLWLLLRRVALTSSLSALQTPRHFLIESNLLELDSKAAWNKRLQTLVDLKILIADVGSYRFKVPLFAEGFRAPRSEYEADVKVRRLAT